MLGAAAQQGARRSRGWDPADLGTAVSWWDMVDSTITKSGANITQVSDLVGSNTLVPNAANPPLDVTSDTDLGRRACQHDSANTESLEVTISSESQPLTLWMIGTLDNITAAYHVLIGGGTFSTYFENAAPDAWYIDDDTNLASSTTTTPAADTPYLFVFVVNGTSSELYINNTSQGMSPGTFSSAAITTVKIGNNILADWSDITWTSAGLTGESMSSGDRASLYAWAQANCNV